MHEKALDDYSTRFNQPYLFESCVADMLRGSVYCDKGVQMAELIDTLYEGFSHGDVELKLIRCKNKVKDVDPTRFRNVLLNLLLTAGTASVFVELQVPRAPFP